VRRSLLVSVMHALDGCDPFEPLIAPERDPGNRLGPWREDWTHALLREEAAAIVLSIKTRPSIIRNCALVTIVTECDTPDKPFAPAARHYSDVANSRDESASSMIETGSVSALLADRRGRIKAHSKGQRAFPGADCPVNRIKQECDHNDRTWAAKSNAVRVPLSGARTWHQARSIGGAS
jgi:hypothetical protein